MPTTAHTPPLFASRGGVPRILRTPQPRDRQAVYPADYSGDAFGHRLRLHHHQAGADGRGREILYAYYDSNRGNPVSIVQEQLTEIYRLAAIISPSKAPASPATARS